MIRTYFKTTILSVVLGVSALAVQPANAASLSFIPSTGEFALSKEIVADLKIDSEGIGVNAAQATIRFPVDILEVKSIDKTDSAFSFWLEEPSFLNTDGVITFIGGTPYGVSGASIQVLRVTFISKGSGVAPITFSDAAVTTSDGSGTNVLSKTTDASFTISPTKETPIITPPTKIIREPAPASDLPVQPVVHISLYPDPTRWHNVSNVFTAAWDLPRDISTVGTALNKQPDYEPRGAEGLFDNKMFQALSDGVWYLHVRFKNKIGWGVPAHYRLAIDTKAPLPFEITIQESEETDNPTPTLSFKADDALSGIANYQVRIDANDWITLPSGDFPGTYTLHPQDPGDHHITVRAVDYAGNSIENSISIKTLPIASPAFTFVTSSLFSNETRGLSLRGTALPSTEILLALKQGEVIITESIVPVDANGNWEFIYSAPLRNGIYKAIIQNRDARGARSLIIDSSEIRVTGKYTNVIISFIILLIGALISGFLFYWKRRERTRLRLEVAQGDISKTFNIIQSDIEKLQQAQRTPTPADDEFAIEKLKQDTEKMGGYIKKEIDRAKK